jgi:hypothetical protein
VRTRQRIRLSVGASGLVKALTVVAGLVMAGVAAFFVVVTIVAGSFAEFVGDVSVEPPVALPSADSGIPGDPGPPNVDLRGPTGVIAAVMRGSALCAVPVVLVAGWLVLRVLRYGAWLDGTTAVVRGALTTRRVDLATAEVRGDAVRHSETHGHYRYVYLLPALFAEDPATGEKLKIPLRGQGLKRLPPAELSALADAIMAYRHPADPAQRPAAAIAAHLRQMAADPFPT